MKLHSYSSIYAVGHRAVSELFNGPVVIEEKVDGSQISFGRIDGQLCIRSKGAEINPDAPDSMFRAGVEAIIAIKDKLVEGIHYRGEYLRKPKHNTLAYDRTPASHIVLFDMDDGQGDFMSRSALEWAAKSLGFDVVPELFRGRLEGGLAVLEALLSTPSFLGGQLIEGVVIKPELRNLFGLDKKLLMAKLVRDEFKELHAKNWKTMNPGQADIIQLLGQSLRSEARWQKAVQHLREAGRLEGSPKDIGALMKEVPADIEKEEKENIQAKLYRWAWPKISRIASAGLAEWYKGELASALRAA